MKDDHSNDELNIGINYFLMFKMVAKYGSFSKTAKRLMLSEGAVRHRIDTIEQYLGLSLLNRKVNGVSLTDAGNLLLTNLQKLDDFIESLNYIRDKYTINKENNIKICAGEIAILEVLPRTLRGFKRNFRETEIFVEAGHAMNCITKLLNGYIDIAIVGEIAFPDLSYEWKKLLAIDIYETTLCVAVPASSHLAVRQKIALNELQKEQIIRRKDGSATQAIVDKLIGTSKTSNGAFHLEMETASGLMQAVSTGLGIGIVSEIQASRFANRSKVKILKLEPNVKIKLKAVINHEKNKISTEEFFNYLKKFAMKDNANSFARKK